eukprot:PhF_6_TR11716/c3_g4_i1/m.19103
MKNSAGLDIPCVTNYKYLGVMILDWNEEFGRRIKLAWCALRNVSTIWASNAKLETKRQLFRALIEPIFTYGLCAWPLNTSRRAEIDSAYSRMLRYALPPASITINTPDHWSTERVYGINEHHTPEPWKSTETSAFISTQLSVRRFTLLTY